MINQKKIAKYLLILILIFLMIMFTISIIISITKKRGMIAQKGTINEKSSEIEFIPPEDEVWQSADREYEETHNDTIAILDEYSLLSERGFLSTQAHFTMNDEITSFLNDNGYPGCEILTVIPDSVYKDSDNAVFSLKLDAYPDTTIIVKSYAVTGSYEFIIKKNN